jgi:hypothetical protein
MGVRIAEFLDRHRADQSRLARAGRARDDHQALGHPIMRENLRLDALLVERLRQVAHGTDDDIRARASAGGDRSHIAAEAERPLPRRTDLIHEVDIAAALQPSHSVSAIKVIDDQARVVLVERIAGRDLAVSTPEAERGRLEGREHHLFGPEPVGVRQE